MAVCVSPAALRKMSRARKASAATGVARWVSRSKYPPMRLRLTLVLNYGNNILDRPSHVWDTSRIATDFQPRTLQEAILWFADPLNCHNAIVAIRWPDGIVKCPRCGSDQVKYLNNARVWKCYGKHPSAKFSLKVGTIFEDSPLPLQKWLPALWLLVNCKNGISSYELGRALDVTQKTAWFMLSRLRLALQSEDGGKLGGEVEADETYIGGKARYMHKSKRERLNVKRGRSTLARLP